MSNVPPLHQFFMLSPPLLLVEHSLVMPTNGRIFLSLNASLYRICSLCTVPPLRIEVNVGITYLSVSGVLLYLLDACK